MIIRYLLLFLLIYIGIRLFLRALFPSMYRRPSAQAYNDPRDRAKKEGEVYIKYKQNKGDKKFRKDDGEYVKFEEVDED